MTRVLIVEDSLTDKLITQRILESNACKVIDLDYKKFNLNDLAAQRPDLVLLDIVMPGVSGYEICRQIKKNERTSDIPVVFVSGKKEQTDILWGKMQGADDYLVKPFQPAELLKIIKRYTAKN